MQLLDQRRISREAARIKSLHFLNQADRPGARFRIVLKLPAKSAEILNVLLLNDALHITGIRCGARRHRLRQFGIVASIDIAIVAIAAAIAATESRAETAARAVAVVHAAGLIIAPATLRIGIALTWLIALARDCRCRLPVLSLLALLTCARAGYCRCGHPDSSLATDCEAARCDREQFPHPVADWPITQGLLRLAQLVA